MQTRSIIFCFLFGFALAANYYIDPNGLDTNDCSAANPCLTISHCLGLSAAGTSMTISLASGNYTYENCGVTLNASSLTSITIAGPAGGPSNVNFTCDDKARHFWFDQLTDTEITLSSITLRRGQGLNSAGGGCIFASGVKKLTLTNMTLTACNTGGNGGGLYSDSVTVISGSTLQGNVAGSGGAIYLESTVNGSVISNSLINLNSAANGGGIYLYGDFLYLQGSDVQSNQADQYGGGLFMITPNPNPTKKLGEFNFLGTNITRNTATLQGAGLYASNLNHSWNIQGALFVNNWDTTSLASDNIACNASAIEFCYACTAKDCDTDCVVDGSSSCSQNSTTATTALCYGTHFTMCSDVSCTCKAPMPTVEKVLIAVIALLLAVGITLVVVDVVRFVLRKRQQNSTYTPIK